MLIKIAEGFETFHNRSADISVAVLSALIIVLPFLLTYAITNVSSYLSIKNGTEGQEPPSIPYAIPFLGNISLSLNTLKFLNFLTKNFHGIPVRIKVGNIKLYFVSGADNIMKLCNNAHHLSTKAWAVWAYVHAFGMPSSDGQFYITDDSGILIKPHAESRVKPEDRLWFKSHHNFGINLKGPGVSELTHRFIESLAVRIAKKDHEIGENWNELPDLFDFVKNEAFIASTTAFCGPHILELNPTLAEDFWDFDSSLPIILKNIPRWIRPRAYAVRDRMQGSIAKWHQYADANFDWEDESKTDILWEPNFGSRVMRMEWKMYRDASVDVSAAGRAAADLGLFWAANANAIPAAGWSLTHIVSDPLLLKRIRSEITPALSSDSVDSVDVTKLNACPLLQSVVAEVLRLRVAAMINRTSIIPNFKLGKWKLEQGKVILGSIYFAHRDGTKWNTGRTLDNGKQEHPVDEFWAERFLEYPSDLLSGPSKKQNASCVPSTNVVHDDREARFTLDGLNGAYIPFGGGIKMCPGRHYAKQEIYLLVTMMLWAFDFEFVDPAGAKKTKGDTALFSVGTLHPDRKNAVKVRRRKNQGIPDIS